VGKFCNLVSQKIEISCCRFFFFINDFFLGKKRLASFDHFFNWVEIFCHFFPIWTIFEKMLTIDVKSSLGRLPMMLHQKNENKTLIHMTQVMNIP
jgi:hypothetical protein